MKETFEFICTGGPYGDCTSSYNVKVNKESMTIDEFIDVVINEKPNEWGYFRIYKFDEQAGQYLEHITIEYRWGKLLDCVPSDISDLKINLDNVRSHGGWSAMDYILKIARI